VHDPARSGVTVSVLPVTEPDATVPPPHAPALKGPL
jgi:hypothetical protein